MTNDVKQRIMDEIQKKSEVFYKVNQVQYRIRCPICGDSQKNLRDAHCYLKCGMDPNEPILYICFKCNARGIVNKQFLDKIGVDPILAALVGNQRRNRLGSYKKANVDIITGEVDLETPQARYLRKRLGKSDILDRCMDSLKVVWDLKNVYPYITDRRVRNTMPNNRDSISFLSDDKSTLLTRNFEDESGRWRKIKIFPSDGKSMYTIKSQFDLFRVVDPVTSDKSISELNIAEGIMDIASVYINLNLGVVSNAAYIAVLGSDYTAGIDYAIAKGIFGSTIKVNLYVDDDVDIKSLKYHLQRYKWLFHSITIFRNLKSKDVGVPISDIKLVSIKV